MLPDFPGAEKVPFEQVFKNFMKSATTTDNILFIHCPGIKSATWPDDVRKLFRANRVSRRQQDEDSPEENWCFLRMAGTIMSGDSKTSLYNGTANYFF